MRILAVLRSLEEAGIDYVVVGGVAVVLRGHPRLTVDLDLALDLSVDNVTAALDVLKRLGLEPRLPVPPSQFAHGPTREMWVRERNLIAFTFFDPQDPLLEVDLLATTPVSYEDLSARADRLLLGDLRVPVAAIPDLLAMKEGTGRSQDQADIEVLTSLLDDRTTSLLDDRNDGNR
ncbi:nucleotidyl transferase AbiEii/AbiGii toxin family protein [Ornithinimicrobium sp. Y1847]|uniref:nucleotidyl transferase AbiEii/AbiGii toxin family protein n=1 Tax=unclassified Ornithinimicrobium TaxID=2615080 RepID=UPI003B678C1E